MKLNMPNQKGYTAIGLAVHHLHRTCIEPMLQHPSAKHLQLDYYPGDRESTVREIIKGVYPGLQPPPVPDPLMESLDSTDTNIKLLVALHLDKYEVSLKYLSPTHPNPWYEEPYHSCLLEFT
jgi:hypothetical protein